MKTTQLTKNELVNKTIMWDIEGYPVYLTLLSEISGISPLTIRNRLKQGWSAQNAIAIPPSLGHTSRTLKLIPDEVKKYNSIGLEMIKDYYVKHPSVFKEVMSAYVQQQVSSK